MGHWSKASHGLHLQSLWLIPFAAVSLHVFDRLLALLLSVEGLLGGFIWAMVGSRVLHPQPLWIIPTAAVS